MKTLINILFGNIDIKTYFFASISISLQIAGTLLLMIFSLSTNRKKLIKKFVINKNIITIDGNTKEITYNHKEFSNMFRDSYISKFSFFYIALGYIISILIEKQKNINKYLLSLSIFVITVTIMLITYFVTSKIVAQSKKINKMIKIEEIDKNQVDEILENISNDEIDILFDKKTYLKDRNKKRD